MLKIVIDDETSTATIEADGHIVELVDVVVEISAAPFHADVTSFERLVLGWLRYKDTPRKYIHIGGALRDAGGKPPG